MRCLKAIGMLEMLLTLIILSIIGVIAVKSFNTKNMLYEEISTNLLLLQLGINKIRNDLFLQNKPLDLAILKDALRQEVEKINKRLKNKNLSFSLQKNKLLARTSNNTFSFIIKNIDNLLVITCDRKKLYCKKIRHLKLDK